MEIETLTNTEEGNNIQLFKLPDKELWPSFASNILFVRDFYPRFFEEYIGKYKALSKVIVCGTPGIGKSAFGSYCIYRALMDKKTVVYHSKMDKKFRIFQNNTVTWQNDEPSRELFENPNTLYIADGVEALQYSCPSLLITSPNKAIWGDFEKKDFCQMKWFGPWNRGNELELLRAHCFPHISEAQLQENCALWGDIPRLTLTKHNLPGTSPAYLQSLIGSHATEVLNAAATLAETGKDNPSHRLFHIVVDDNFDQIGRDFASKWIRSEIYEYLKTKHKSRLQEYLYSAFDNRELHFNTGTYANKLFEQYCIDEMSRGGKYECVDMFEKNFETGSINKAVHEVDLSACKGKSYFLELIDVKQNAAVLYVPKRTNFTAADYLYVHNKKLLAFNTTSTVKHDIIMESVDTKSGLYPLYKKLCEAEHIQDISFYFVIPEPTLKKELPKKLKFDKGLTNWTWKVDPKEDPNLVKRLSQDEKIAFERKVNYFYLKMPIRKMHTMVSRVIGRLF